MKTYKIFALALCFFLIVHCTLKIDNCYAQWVQMSNGIGNAHVSSLAANVNTIFAGTFDPPNGVYKSTNNGTTWTQTTLNNETVTSLAVNGNNVFAGTAYSGKKATYGYVYLSTNNGTNWEICLALDPGLVMSLAVNGNNVFAGTWFDDGVYLSTNNGTTWGQTLYNQTVTSLAVNGNYVFAGAGNGVYLSTNNGTNWTQTPLNNRWVHSLAVKGDTIFAGTDYYGVYLSTNNGTNWTQTPLNNQHVYSLSIYGNNVFAGTCYSNGVNLSTNNGTNWIQWNEGLGNTCVFALCILNNYIFAGTFGNSVYRRPLDELTGIQPISGQLPAHYSLEQNYPNPFNPTTKIRFALPKSSFAKLVVYDILGRELETLVNEQLNAGTYEADWPAFRNADKFSSGVYYYKIVAGDYTETKKMILIK